MRETVFFQSPVLAASFSSRRLRCCCEAILSVWHRAAFGRVSSYAAAAAFENRELIRKKIPRPCYWEIVHHVHFAESLCVEKRFLFAFSFSVDVLRCQLLSFFLSQRYVRRAQESNLKGSKDCRDRTEIQRGGEWIIVDRCLGNQCALSVVRCVWKRCEILIEFLHVQQDKRGKWVSGPTDGWMDGCVHLGMLRTICQQVGN